MVVSAKQLANQHGYDEVTLPKSPPVLTSWRQANALNAKGRRQWELDLRKLKKGVTPAAIVRITPAADDEDTEPIPYQSSVYRFDQTQAYDPTSRTLAYHDYERIYLEPSRKDKFIYWLPEEQDWRYVSPKKSDATESDDADKPYYRLLSAQKVREHLNNRNIYGVIANKRTRFAAIDLDYHGRDRQIFLEQAKILLEKFRTTTWHYQIGETNTNGLHFIRTYDRRYKTDKVLKGLRELLGRFDEAYPDLAARAKAAGMPSFSRLELFPSPSHGFRLPLCRGRTLLLDRPLETIQGKNGLVQDVESYIAWLQDPNHQRMSVDEMMQLIDARLSVGQGRPPKNFLKNTKPEKVKLPTSDETLGPLKGRFRSTLVDFYSGRLQIPNSLNEGLLLGATACWIEQIPEDQAIDLLVEYAFDIPDPSFSTRLSSGNEAEVRRVATTTVKNFYSSRNDPQNSTDRQSVKQLLKVRDRWKEIGFKFSEKTTWHKASTKQRPAIAWTDEEQARIIKTLSPILKIKDPAKVIAIAEDVVNVVWSKQKSNNGISIKYWKERLSKKFGVKLGHHGKANAVIDCCVKLGLITVVATYQFSSSGLKGKAKRYAVHPVLIERLQ